MDALEIGGIVMFEQGKYADAIARFSQAVAIDPTLASVYERRGTAYYANREYVKAVADYKMAMELNPAHPEIGQLLRDAEKSAAKEKLQGTR